MAIDKLIPQYLNTDTDQKLVKSVEMTDNLNVRVSNDAEGTDGVIKNIKGNTVVAAQDTADAFPTSGISRVVGSVSNEVNQEIIFLLYNSANSHGIYKLDLTNGKYRKLYEDSVLNFSQFQHVECDIIVNEENETLFYWTDNINPPQKLNITRLERGTYPSSLTSGTDEEKLKNLTVAKQPPLRAPSFNYVNNKQLGKNNLYEKTYQFAYAYKYTDGELSSLSPYSPLAVSSSQLKDGLIEQSTKDFFNEIDVFVRTSSADVDEIFLYVRRGGSETFFEIEKIKNNGANDLPKKIKFRDDKISRALSVDDVNKTYNNVPQLAKAQAIVQNRLMYGNYTEGYENTTLNVEANTVHHDATTVFKVPVSLIHNGGTSGDITSKSFPQKARFELDFSNVPATLSTSDIVFIDFSLVINEFQVKKSSPSIIDRGRSVITLDVLQTKTDSEEINDFLVVSTTGDDGSIIYNLDIQGIRFNKKFTFSSTTTRETFAEEVNDFLTGNFFGASVSCKNLTKDYANNMTESFSNGVITQSATPIFSAWFAGTAFFSFNPFSDSDGVFMNGTTKVRVDLNFSGAELFITDISSSRNRTNKVLKSSVITIGGDNQNNKFKDLLVVDFEENDTKYTDYLVAGNSSFGGTFTGAKTFKADSAHSFGIVYMDDRGRTGGVNKIDDVFVEALHNRTKRGRTEIDFSITNTPPTWAKKWKIVYAGNATVDKFLQYSTGEAYVNLAASESVAAPLGNRIYISMQTLEGNENSYKNQTGANLEYKYQAGDILRIISYKDDSNATVFPVDHDFNVVDYKFFNEEEAKQFVNPTGTTAPSGFYLIIESEDFTGFSRQAVLNRTEFWGSETIIELRTNAKEVEEKAYFGLGKTYDIKTVSGQRIHEGDRSVESISSVTVTIDSSGNMTSSNRLYVGDTLTITSVAVSIIGVSELTDGTYAYDITTTGSISANTYGDLSVGNYLRGVATVSQGDAYTRVRRLSLSDNFSFNDLPEKLRKGRFAYTGGYIEDSSVSDFFSSSFITKGKPYAHIPEAKTIRRKSSVTYSDFYALDSDRLNLGSFNLSLANFKDLDIEHGSINKLLNRAESLCVIQENKASESPVSRNIIQFDKSSGNIAASREVLGLTKYYAGDFGTSNPESVVLRFGVVYYVDYKRARVIRLSADGVTVISDKGMNSFFETAFKKILESSTGVFIAGGFDPDNNEYLVTVQPTNKKTVTIGSDTFDIPSDTSGNNLFQGFSFNETPVSWGIWGNNWNQFCGNWEDIGNGVVFVDSAFNQQNTIIDTLFENTTSTINVIITDSDFTFSAIGQYSLQTRQLTFPSTTCEGASISFPNSGNPVQEQEGFTIAYKHKNGVWGAKYSFRPSAYANINNELYSFSSHSSGMMWRHNVNDTRNNFYGVQYTSIIEAVSNFNPSMVKVFEALAVEGNGTWSGVLTTSDQSTTIGTTDFDEREGHKYAMIFRDTLVSTSHKIYLGKVSSVDTTGTNRQITFTSDVNKIPFVADSSGSTGDLLMKPNSANDGLESTLERIHSLVSRNVIQTVDAIDASKISADTELFVEKTARIDGDPMRDVFLKIRLTSTDTTAFEVHALSISYDRSRLHNDKVN
jgi:hypothetical protein